MSLKKPKVTLFDLDKTLIPIDSDQQWGSFTCDIGWNNKQEFRDANNQFYQDYCNGTLKLAEYVRFSTNAICKKGPSESFKARARFMSEVIHNVIDPKAMALVKKHQDAGDQVVIVTATNRFVVEPICHLFNVQEILAVELETACGEHGTAWYTGEIKGIPSFKEGKIQRVEDWLHAKGWEWGDVYTTFYSDSHNDLPLLKKVDLAIATNPDQTLLKTAHLRGWEVLDLFKKMEGMPMRAPNMKVKPCDD